jgi:hypothetical protein
VSRPPQAQAPNLPLTEHADASKCHMGHDAEFAIVERIWVLRLDQVVEY